MPAGSPAGSAIWAPTPFPLSLSWRQNLFECYLCSGPCRFFVNKSEQLLSVGIHTTSIRPCSFILRKKYIFTSACRVLPPDVQLCVRSFAPILLTCSSIGNLTLRPIELSTRIAYSISCAHSVAATSSASVTESVTQLCIRLVVEIGAPFRKMAYPLTLLRCSGSLAKSLLLYPEMSSKIPCFHSSLHFQGILRLDVVWRLFSRNTIQRAVCRSPSQLQPFPLPKFDRKTWTIPILY